MVGEFGVVVGVGVWVWVWVWLGVGEFLGGVVVGR